mmetsp:Transcript_15242/g.31346  ORF Transcript_15242/g.31346 Transcript_15242/m.31346 type:complete len:736 (-) Transcript_15242:133-2340(-)
MGGMQSGRIAFSGSGIVRSLITLLLIVAHATVNAEIFPKSQRITSRKPIRGGSTLIGRESTSRPPLSPFRVAFQGESGAYSEKAVHEMLGQKVQTIGKASFEDAFKAVASHEVDYALLPIENSLGGSIHTNYDLLLRYNLHIVGEHTLRVRHCLLALPGTKKKDVSRVMSHPQALAQCDNYLRAMGATPESQYDTAGSAKLIKEGGLKKCAAIASDLAAEIYGLEVLDSGIEDDDVNYTRFLLLAREPVGTFIPPEMPSKTTLVFLIDNKAGALYRALACFALRDIDLTKCESRPTSVQLLNYLAFSSANSNKSPEASSARFRYCFYLDYNACELDPSAQAALFHLREQSDFVRVLGSYPSDSQLVGPIVDSIAAIKDSPPQRLQTPTIGDKNKATSPPVLATSRKGDMGRDGQIASMPLPDKTASKLRVGIVGFGKFGQYLAKTLVKHCEVIAIDKDDMSSAASSLGVEFFPLFQMPAFMRRPLDVVLFSVSILSFEEVLRSISPSDLREKLVVDVLSVKAMPKALLKEVLPEDTDVLCTHPMFGPESAPNSWQSLPFVYEQVRINNFQRCHQFLHIFESERCNMIEMSAELHDKYSLEPQFVTHLMGRIIGEQKLRSTPVDMAGFKHAQRLADVTCGDSFDLFFALFKHTPKAAATIASVRESMASVERQLAAKEAFLSAQAEYKQTERGNMLREFRAAIKEATAQPGQSTQVPPPDATSSDRGLSNANPTSK